MRIRLLLGIVLLIAGCANIEPALQVDYVLRDTSVNATEPENRTEPRIEDGQTVFDEGPGVNDEGYADWRKNSVGATMLISDGKKAARLYLKQGESALLNTQPRVNVTILRVGGEGDVQLMINDEITIMRQEEDKQFMDGQIIVFVDEVFP